MIGVVHPCAKLDYTMQVVNDTIAGVHAISREIVVQPHDFVEDGLIPDDIKLETAVTFFQG